MSSLEFGDPTSLGEDVRRYSCSSENQDQGQQKKRYMALMSEGATGRRNTPKEMEAQSSLRLLDTMSLGSKGRKSSKDMQNVLIRGKVTTD